jgi:hypothetical protein
MFNINDYSQKLKNRNNQLQERFTELQTQRQLISKEMKFIEIELSHLDGQMLVISLVEEKANKETKLED